MAILVRDGQTMYEFPATTWVYVDEATSTVKPLTGAIAAYANEALAAITLYDLAGNPWTPAATNGTMPAFRALQYDSVILDGGGVRQAVVSNDLAEVIDDLRTRLTAVEGTTSGVQTVNAEAPDGTGNVTIDALDVGAAPSSHGHQDIADAVGVVQNEVTSLPHLSEGDQTLSDRVQGIYVSTTALPTDATARAAALAAIPSWARVARFPKV